MTCIMAIEICVNVNEDLASSAFFEEIMLPIEDFSLLHLLHVRR